MSSQPRWLDVGTTGLYLTKAQLKMVLLGLEGGEDYATEGESKRYKDDYIALAQYVDDTLNNKERSDKYYARNKSGQNKE